ncbi:20111_t:CDS:2 [Entrophospora sp. SA101]|nr:6614_t:CDS:2 [Entrophospora candida]CAH1762217.1 9590_t:CDS:2 [Entrophospora sp. SA101]CAJ0638815.1 2082_t:CDS:2 [Entrophospora sp. SA101]CAJ0761510.1 20111_t:CDS:2 [Entrophospora sp. SA101]CAJ0831950.1 8518_t:CDS:2 [Entrophospora sp. SA101]
MFIHQDNRVENAATFDIQKEDHTMGNLIRHKLLQEPHVIFAGYKVPHPLENNIFLRVQTTNLGRARALAIPLESKQKEEHVATPVPKPSKPQREQQSVPSSQGGVGMVDMDF